MAGINGNSQITPSSFTIHKVDRLVTALSARVVLGARRVWGKLGNLLALAARGAAALQCPREAQSLCSVLGDLSAVTLRHSERSP